MQGTQPVLSLLPRMPFLSFIWFHWSSFWMDFELVRHWGSQLLPGFSHCAARYWGVVLPSFLTSSVKADFGVSSPMSSRADLCSRSVAGQSSTSENRATASQLRDG
mgnify:CR=1 FL=1